jgi:hypothetical protein
MIECKGTLKIRNQIIDKLKLVNNIKIKKAENLQEYAWRSLTSDLMKNLSKYQKHKLINGLGDLARKF